MKGPFLSQERLQLGKVLSQERLSSTGQGFSNFAFPGKDPFLEKEKFATGKGPFLSQNGNFERFERGKERKAFRPSRLESYELFEGMVWKNMKYGK